MEPSAKSYVCDLTPYQPGKPTSELAREYRLDPDTIIKLASNENPLGMGDAARLAIQDAAAQAHRYPEQFNLVQAIAAHTKLSPGQIVLGNGSNDVLDLIARTYLGTGDEAIVSEYAFAMYQLATQATGARTVVAAADEYGHGLAAMLHAITDATKIIWIANPNNPTGTFIDYDALQVWIEQVPPEVIIVLDEAYYEYLSVGDQADTARWLSDYPNLILVRTFSKIHGLAGLRIGYGLAAPGVAELLNRLRQPFNANTLALAAATAALTDRSFVVRSYNANLKGREWLIDGLEALGLACLPAYGNFVTVQVPDATRIYRSLLRQGIIVRPLAGYGMPDHLRITVGLLKENEAVLRALTASITNA